MANTSITRRLLAHKLKLAAGRFVESEAAGTLAALPPVAWGIRAATRALLARARVEPRALVARAPERVARGDLQSMLEGIVYDVVEVLGYAVAMVATYERGDVLQMRAVYINPEIVSLEQVRRWEEEISALGRRVSLFDPEVTRVFVYDEDFSQNLSVVATRAGRPVVSDELYSLFTPIVPPAARPVVAQIQEQLGVGQVVDVPFFLDPSGDRAGAPPELVGNLFALKCGTIADDDIRALAAFARQAAASILSERRRLQIQIAQRLIYDIQAGLADEEWILQHITEGLVNDLGFVIALVATVEAGTMLPVRAFSVDPQLASREQIGRWEQQLSAFGRPVSLSDPTVARVFLDDDAYAENLSVIAARRGAPVTSDELYTLFTPIVPAAARPAVAEIQRHLGVRQVVAVPFFLDVPGDATAPPRRELVGNLFAMSPSRQISAGDMELLQEFGRQAAAGLRNARLYRQSENRRRSAQIFGTMAFSAATSVHELSNHIGAIRLSVDMLKMGDMLSEADRAAIGETVSNRLHRATELLKLLHEPWRRPTETSVDINECIRRVAAKVVPDLDGMRLCLADDLPPIDASQDMLAEVFRVMIKNAVEAVGEQLPHAAQLGIEVVSQQAGEAAVEVAIRDAGVGIRPEHLARVFELNWSTKATGLGFGLFWAKDYIEGLGGTIRVESTLGVGTTFFIRIPVKRVYAPAVADYAHEHQEHGDDE